MFREMKEQGMSVSEMVRRTTCLSEWCCERVADSSFQPVFATG